MAVVLGTKRVGNVGVGLALDPLTDRQILLKRPDHSDVPAAVSDVFVTDDAVLLGLGWPNGCEPLDWQPPEAFRLNVDLTGPVASLGSVDDLGLTESDLLSSDYDVDPTSGMAFRSGYGQELRPLIDRRFRGGIHSSLLRSLLEVRDEEGVWYELRLPIRAHEVIGDGTGWFFTAGENNYVLANVLTGELQVGAQADEFFAPSALVSSAALDNIPAELVADRDALSRMTSLVDERQRERHANRRKSVTGPPMHRDNAELPSLRLVATNNPSGRSRLGGRPDLAGGMKWPTVDQTPLPFLAQIDLDEVQRCLPLAYLPEAGLLSVFYCPFLDSYEEHVGYDQIKHLAEQQWRILHVPPGPTSRAEWPEHLPNVFRWSSKSVEPVVENTRQTLTFDINDPDRPEPPDGSRHWAETKGAYERALLPGPLHRFGGHADYVQPTELGDLILQVDSDPDLGWGWSDGGRIYVTVARLDALAPDLSNVEVREESH